MKEKRRKIIIDFLLILSIICYSGCFVFGLFALRSSSQYTVDFVLDHNADDNFLYEYGISYGSINLSHSFSGELIKTKDKISLNKETKLSVRKYDIIKKGQKLGTKNDQDIYSSFDGIILDIIQGDSLDIVYQDFNRTYCVFEIENIFQDYFSTNASYTVFIDEVVNNLQIAKIMTDGNRTILTTDYFYYDQYMNNAKTYINLNLLRKNNVLRIENKYLTNQLSDNKYLLKIYNPNVSENRLYEVIIETGVQSETYTEIISKNVLPYEAIIV